MIAIPNPNSRFDPQALTSLTLWYYKKGTRSSRFDPQALTSLTVLPIHSPSALPVSIHRLLRA